MDVFRCAVNHRISAGGGGGFKFVEDWGAYSGAGMLNRGKGEALI